jgi:hypothetical protein
MQATIQSDEALTSTRIENSIDQVAEKKKERSISKLEPVKKEVKDIIKNRDYNRLNGKWIIRNVAGTVGESGEALTRRAAEQRHELNQRPDEIENIFNNIDQSCSRDLSPLYE